LPHLNEAANIVDPWSHPMFIESLESRINLTALPSGFAESVIAANLGDPRR